LNKLRLHSLLLFIIILNGCSSFGGLKFWDSEDEEEGPAELFAINTSVEISTDWSESFGNENNFGRLIPSVYDGKVYFISSEGYLASLDADSGKMEWSKNTNDIVSGGVDVDFKTITYGTLDGDLVALDYKDGKELWRSKTSSEILTPPVTDGNMLIAQTGDGRIAGYDFKSGKRQWFHQTTLPRLTLRGTSRPYINQGFIFTGFANGKIAMIYPDSGAIRFEIPVTINEGKSELERIIDIDGKSLITNDLLIAASYQGNITAINLREGRPAWQEDISTIKDLAANGNRVMVVDEKGSVKAFGVATGAILWEQNDLKLRKLTSPVSIRNFVAVGDLEGYVHLLDAKNGDFLGREKISRKPILELTSERNFLLAVDESGKLFKLSLN
jgi:outer membrane protein assembly factor BamB